jgi:adenylate kinase
MSRAKAIIVTGTPGTGKTTLAKRLARELGYMYVDANTVIKEDRLQEGYDRKRKSVIVDERRLAKAIARRIRMADGGMVIDSHLSHHVPPSIVDACIVTVCELKVLDRRLRKKGYAEAKVNENVQAEIFETCTQEAWEMGHRPIVVDTTRGVKLQAILQSLEKKGIRKKKGFSSAPRQ